ncbi:MAG: helix-turn-helix transcriptional regulator [Devosia sp.]|nr:helix-turn-helix transcriptional regulator [Devosia sp.]
MAYSNPLTGHPDAAQLRKEAGAYLKRLREDASLTQAELAKAVGLEYYTFVSQVENGKTRIPPEKYAAWSKAVGTTPHQFAKRLLRFYDPYTWDALFGKSSGGEE